MSSLKAITRGVARDKKTRGSKDKANQRIENMSESDDISSDESDIALKMNRNPIVTKNAESSDLNFVKQYKNRLQYCNRGLFAIDTKRGSKNKEKMEYICIDFQTGLFEALKKNAIAILEKELSVAVTGRPKVELYGLKSAEEKFCIDLEIEVEGKKHVVS